MHKELGEDTSREADPDWTKNILYHTASCSGKKDWSKERGLGGGVWSADICLPESE